MKNGIKVFFFKNILVPLIYKSIYFFCSQQPPFKPLLPPLLPLLLTNQGQKLSLPFGQGTKGQSTVARHHYPFYLCKKQRFKWVEAKVVMVIIARQKW